MVTAMSGEKSSSQAPPAGVSGHGEHPGSQSNNNANPSSQQQDNKKKDDEPKLPPSLAFTAQAHPATLIAPAAQDSPNYLTYKKVG